jgi:hypothetical protein
MGNQNFPEANKDLNNVLKLKPNDAAVKKEINTLKKVEKLIYPLFIIL